MEPKPDEDKLYDNAEITSLPERFNEELKFPQPSEEFRDRVNGELAVYSQPGGRFKYSVVAGTRIYEVIGNTKLGLVYKGIDKRTHIALIPNIKSIEYPVDPDIKDRISITYRSNNANRYLHLSIGGFKGIYFEDKYAHSDIT